MDRFCSMEKKVNNDFAENCNRPPRYSLYKEGFAVILNPQFLSFSELHLDNQGDTI
jgi:hypothetical protein